MPHFGKTCAALLSRESGKQEAARPAARKRLSLATAFLFVAQIANGVSKSAPSIRSADVEVVAVIANPIESLVREVESLLAIEALRTVCSVLGWQELPSNSRLRKLSDDHARAGLPARAEGSLLAIETESAPG